MANERHVKILKEKGVKAWNEWRKQNPRTKPNLLGENLSDANLIGADLRGADLTRAKLIGTNLRGADLTRAYLSEADLIGADLSGATLIGADLSGATLYEANLSRATLSGADFTNSSIAYTITADLDLSDVKGLVTVRHRGPSTVGIDTIYKSKGNIPEVFLREAGVPENFVAYMKSLAGTPSAFEYYSSFISYSSKDQGFADLLHSQMRGKDLRVWLATEDLKIGDKFRAKIDEAIRIYDKLLLVLSKDSVKSPWVESEVEAAFEKERKQNRIVLFPIRLDDAVMETEEAWAADIRRTRHIGDFRKWKDHDEFQKAFARLMRDLKSSGE